MNRGKFIEEYTRFIQTAVRFGEGVKERGTTVLEENVWDLDGSIFKDGLILILDEADPAVINEILSNKIAYEKDKYTRLFMTIQKRAVLGIQEELNTRILYKLLNSLVDLKRDEEHRIELLLFSDDDESETNTSENDRSRSAETTEVDLDDLQYEHDEGKYDGET
jgi:flagellar motor component MotA